MKVYTGYYDAYLLMPWFDKCKMEFIQTKLTYSFIALQADFMMLNMT